LEEYKENDNKGNIKYIKLIYSDEILDQNRKAPIFNTRVNVSELDNSKLINISERARAIKNTQIKKCLEVPNQTNMSKSNSSTICNYLDKSTVRDITQSNSIVVGIDKNVYGNWFATINRLIPAN